MKTARLFWEINMDVPQKTLPQKTADQIIDYVVENHLKPGEKLPTEKELSARLCVSRSVMREALSILATMHIIRAVQGSGIYLEKPENAIMLSSYQAYMRLGYASIDEMYELRIRLEADAAALTAKRISQSGIYELELCLNKAHCELSNEKKFSEADGMFHQIIAEHCQNRLLIMNLRSILEIVEQYRSITVQYLDIRKRAYEYHKSLYTAIRNRDAVAARMYMEDHLKEVKRSADFYHLFHSTGNQKI